MKHLFLLFAVIFLSGFSPEYTWKVGKVIDADTIHVYISNMPDVLNPFSIRVNGIDTPEKGYRAKCEAEDKLSRTATVYVENLLAKATTISIVVHGHDKYGGRFLGDIFVDGKMLSDLLLKKGYARPYDGGKKSSWC